MSFLIVIPARLASTRLPEKPLIDIDGKSMIQRTYERCLLAFSNEKILVATDDVKIEQHCKDRNMNVMLTSSNCLTGTDRVAEVAEKIDVDYYINVQGDEPLINPEDIKNIVEATQKFKGEIINGYTSIHDELDYRSLTIPKVVFKPNGELLYMSRSPIPGNKTGKFVKSWRQVCIYAFPKTALKEFTKVTSKTVLEEQEDIEILRFLELDFKVRMIEMSDESIAVDTPEDVQKVINRLNQIN
jgi:3-deoxy-manno-octulosonate cytidylyltransferase (CMP-KDO synthetase)